MRIYIASSLVALGFLILLVAMILQSNRIQSLKKEIELSTTVYVVKGSIILRTEGYQRESSWNEDLDIWTALDSTRNLLLERIVECNQGDTSLATWHEVTETGPVDIHAIRKIDPYFNDRGRHLLSFRAWPDKKGFAILDVFVACKTKAAI